MNADKVMFVHSVIFSVISGLKGERCTASLRAPCLVLTKPPKKTPKTNTKSLELSKRLSTTTRIERILFT